MPSESKCNFLILGATQLEADGGSDAIGMRNDLRDVYPHVMSGAGVSQDASAFHDGRDVKISKERILP
jgi:hypothetical protein